MNRTKVFIPVLVVATMIFLGALIVFFIKNGPAYPAQVLIGKYGYLSLSPDGLHGLVGTSCEVPTEGPVICQYRLADAQTGELSSWSVMAGGASWSADNTSFVLEGIDGAALIGGVHQPAVRLALNDRVVAPVISPSGKLIAGQILGFGDDRYMRSENSPGIGIYEVTTGQRIALLESSTGYKFAPFFITDNEIVYGEDDPLRRTALFKWNRTTGAVRQLTNLQPQEDETFPGNFAFVTGRSVALIRTDSSDQAIVETLNVDTLERKLIGRGRYAILEGGHVRVLDGGFSKSEIINIPSLTPNILNSTNSVTTGVLGEDQGGTSYDVLVDRTGIMHVEVEWDFSGAKLFLTLYDELSNALRLSNPVEGKTNAESITLSVVPGRYQLGIENISSVAGTVHFRLEMKTQ